MYLDRKQKKCKSAFEYQSLSVFVNESRKKAGDKKRRQGREKEQNGFML